MGFGVRKCRGWVQDSGTVLALLYFGRIKGIEVEHDELLYETASLVLWGVKWSNGHGVRASTAI